MTGGTFGFGLKHADHIHILVGMPVREVANPEPGSRREACDRCGEAVWLSPTVARAAPLYRLLCPACFDAAGYTTALERAMKEGKA